MHAQGAGPSSAEVATEASSVLAGLGILTFALFPVAVPGLLLFVIAPLALVAVLGALLAIPLVLAVWLTRMVVRAARSSMPSRRRSGRRAARRPLRRHRRGADSRCA